MTDGGYLCGVFRGPSCLGGEGKEKAKGGEGRKAGRRLVRKSVNKRILPASMNALGDGIHGRDGLAC